MFNNSTGFDYQPVYVLLKLLNSSSHSLTSFRKGRGDSSRGLKDVPKNKLKEIIN
jgi:hypothetical protein